MTAPDGLVGFEGWAALAGDSPTSRTEWSALIAAWSGPHRRYHDLAHLAAVLGLVLQHVLPKGFRRARNFGFLHPNSKRLIRLLHYLLKLDPAWALKWIRQRPALTCRCCGGPMKIVRTRIPSPPARHHPSDALAAAALM